jgi:hypothetical protein
MFSSNTDKSMDKFINSAGAQKAKGLAPIAVCVFALMLPALVYQHSYKKGELVLLTEDWERVVEVKEKRDSYVRQVEMRTRYEKALNNFAQVLEEKNLLADGGHSYSVDVDQEVELKSVPVKLASMKSAEGKYYFPRKFSLSRGKGDVPETLEMRVNSFAKAKGSSMTLKLQSEIKAY